VTPLVRLDGVGFAYPKAAPGHSLFEIRDLSFAVAPGEVLGLIGPNAAGKTTVIHLLSKVLTPSRGEIFVEGEPLRSLGRAEVARRVAVVPQDVAQGFPYTVGELVLMGRFAHAPGRFFESAADARVAREAMRLTGVEALAGETLGRLSGGERQRVVLARALAQEPRLLVLDEPTAHLDLRYQAETAALLRGLNRERGMTILLVSHDLNLAAELCDRLLLLSAGEVARVGAAVDVLEQGLLESVFGCHVTVDKSPSGRPVVQLAYERG